GHAGGEPGGNRRRGLRRPDDGRHPGGEEEMSDPILLERDGDVAELVLNRPERRNALDQPAVAALGGALDELEKNPPRALLLRGEGKGFCAGRDLSDAEPLTEDGEAILRDSLNPLI